MKIGIVSDIHAHIDPLKRAIALFKSKDVDQIICAGDLVDGGWHEEAVIDCIRSNNIVAVRGNHDREAYTESLEQWNVDDDFADSINSYRYQYVTTLPTSRQFEWEGHNVFVTHGAPWSDTYHVFPTASRDVCQRILNATKADVVVLGHTHIPMKLKMDGKWILNSGALCGNRHDLCRTCGILELPKVNFELYDTDTMKIVELETVTIEAK